MLDYVCGKSEENEKRKHWLIPIVYQRAGHQLNKG